MRTTSAVQFGKLTPTGAHPLPRVSHQLLGVLTGRIELAGFRPQFSVLFEHSMPKAVAAGPRTGIDTNDHVRPWA